jgi:hypothetical protein
VAQAEVNIAWVLVKPLSTLEVVMDILAKQQPVLAAEVAAKMAPKVV